MQQMAALWLKEEVRTLEERVGDFSHPNYGQRRNGPNSLSPYLVADSDVFTQHMGLIKQLLDSKRFILVVPSVGKFYLIDKWILNCTPTLFMPKLWYRN